MKIDITITKGETTERKSIDFPTTWSQVTFKQYVDYLYRGGDSIKIISLFTGLDEELVRSAQIHNLSPIIACLSFMQKPPEYPVPVKIMGYPVATNLDTESVAQFEDLKTIIASFKEDDHEFNYSQFPLICATYAVKPYHFKEAEKLAPQFFNAPCPEVIAIGNFTLVRFSALSRGIVPTSPPAATRLNRLRLALTDWLQTLVSSIRYYTWKRSLPSQERNYLNGR